MEAWKGHRLLLEALGRLRHVPGWVLWVAGGAQRPYEARYLAELEAQATELGIRGRVRFLGQRSDVPRLLRAADIHCQPNLGPEPFGIAFIEALQARLPVVTTAMGGPLEIIDGSCGVLVAPRPERHPPHRGRHGEAPADVHRTENAHRHLSNDDEDERDPRERSLAIARTRSSFVE